MAAQAANLAAAPAAPTQAQATPTPVLAVLPLVLAVLRPAVAVPQLVLPVALAAVLAAVARFVIPTTRPRSPGEVSPPMGRVRRANRPVSVKPLLSTASVLPPGA